MALPILTIGDWGKVVVVVKAPPSPTQDKRYHHQVLSPFADGNRMWQEGELMPLPDLLALVAMASSPTLPTGQHIFLLKAMHRCKALGGSLFAG